MAEKSSRKPILRQTIVECPDCQQRFCITLPIKFVRDVVKTTGKIPQLRCLQCIRARQLQARYGGCVEEYLQGNASEGGGG